MIVTERERETETQAEGEAGSMHREPHVEPDVGLDPGSPGSRPGPKAGAKPLHHPGIPDPQFSNIAPPSLKWTLDWWVDGPTDMRWMDGWIFA